MLARFILVALLLVLPAGARAQGTPSPADWRDVPIYQVFTDRFFDGDPSNNNLEGSYDPGNASGDFSTWYPGNVHGGDFAGIMEKLDYIQALGFRAVWISPVQLNYNGAHHGYHAINFQAIAPHFGTEQELRALADALHARGMYLILDVVCNHTADLITSVSPGYPNFQNPGTYVLSWRNATRPAPPFNNLAWYHNNGEIQNYVDPDQILGELAGLDDLRTENASVRAALIDAFNWLIDVSDCDGFRIDTVKHTELGFWQAWAPAVRSHAASIGKSNFFLYGEVFDGSDTNNGRFTGTKAGGPFALDSVLYFPMLFTMQGVFGFGAPTSDLTARYSYLGEYDPVAQPRLLHFLDNHDVARFLSFGVANQDATKLNAALGFITTTRGIPLVYQGTEQAFDGGGDPYDREDMWDGEWEYGPSHGDNFNMTHPQYIVLRRLMEARAAYPALRTGGFTELVNSGGSGVYGYLRTGPEDVLVVVNTATSSRTTGNLPTNWTSGTVVSDLLDAAFSGTVTGGGTLLFSVPARSTRLIVRGAAVLAPVPAVDTQSPAHDAVVSDPRPPIRLGFNRAMNHTAVHVAWDIDPFVPGTFSWEADSAVVFTPSVDLPQGQAITVRLEATAQAQDGTPLRAAFETFFTTTGGVPGLTVATGFTAEILASGAALGTPEGIEPGVAGAWAGDMFVGDADQGRILRVTPAGVVTTHATHALLAKPEGLSFDRAGTWGGDLLVADSNGLLRVTAAGGVSQIAAGGGGTGTGALWCMPAGGFGGFPYLANNAADRLERYEPGTGYVAFAAGIPGAEGVTEASGPFGSGLLAANPDLTAFSPAINGNGSVLHVDAAGVVTPFVTDPALLGGVVSLLVDTQGAFGGDLLAADIALERVVRVDSTGAITVLASGFGNLFSSDCLALGDDGSLWVVDTGSGEPFTDTSGGSAEARIVRIRAQSSVSVPVDPVRPVTLRVAPHPLRGSGVVSFTLPHAGTVTLDLFDLQGRRIGHLWERRFEAGSHEAPISLDPALARGIYFLRLRPETGPPAVLRLVLVR